jgi:hypothetical protein
MEASALALMDRSMRWATTAMIASPWLVRVEVQGPVSQEVFVRVLRA